MSKSTCSLFISVISQMYSELSLSHISNFSPILHLKTLDICFTSSPTITHVLFSKLMLFLSTKKSIHYFTYLSLETIADHSPNLSTLTISNPFSSNASQT